MHVCVRVHTYVRMYVCMHVCMYYLCLCMYVCMYICMCVCDCMYMIQTHICIHIPTYKHKYIKKYLDIYLYIHTQSNAHTHTHTHTYIYNQLQPISFFNYFSSFHYLFFIPFAMNGGRDISWGGQTTLVETTQLTPTPAFISRRRGIFMLGLCREALLKGKAQYS
jgi:hypothetical protein